VLDRWASQLLAAAAAPVERSSGIPAPARVQVPDSVACLVCDAQMAAQSATVNAILQRLRQRPDEALASLSEICVPHLRLLVAALGSGPIAAKLLAREAAMLHRMAEDMRRYALKHDGARRYLASDEETRAASRGLLVLAGHRTLNTQPSRQ
jgi:hypothetical protein